MHPTALVLANKGLTSTKPPIGQLPRKATGTMPPDTQVYRNGHAGVTPSDYPFQYPRHPAPANGRSGVGYSLPGRDQVAASGHHKGAQFPGQEDDNFESDLGELHEAHRVHRRLVGRGTAYPATRSKWWHPSKHLADATLVVVKEGGPWCFFSALWLLIIISIGRAIM